MTKRVLYSEFLTRMDAATRAGMFFEAAWYAYAVLEDRLRSLLRQSGGEMDSKGKTIRIMGPKILELERRAKNDAPLRASFERGRLWSWKESRDKLMHGMAEGGLSISQIDAMVKTLASDGSSLARDYAAAAMRLKNRRKTAGRTSRSTGMASRNIASK